MNRFLKKQWDDTRIPEDAMLRARNRAWQHLQEPPDRPRRRIGWLHAAAFAGALVVIVLMWVRPVEAPEPALIPGQLPLRSGAAEPALRPEIRLAPQPVSQAEAPAPPLEAPRPPAAPERIVVNFRLPESGIRMIWIMDPNFRLSGGTE